MMQFKPLRTVTADCRAINIGELSKLGAFKRPMHFPFRGIETRRDFIRLRSLKNPNSPPQIILIEKRRITYGMKTFFICPRCQAKRAILYFDGLQAYCRVCADLRFASQRQRRRARLRIKSHKIRASLGDEKGKPGDPFPPRQYLKSRKVYERKIASAIEHELLTKHRSPPRYRREPERNRDGSFVLITINRPAKLLTAFAWRSDQLASALGVCFCALPTCRACCSF